jgi:long-subunit fatty acid transport protein
MSNRLTVCVLALALTTPCLAQNTDIEALAGLQFEFGNPGARALGMGGAFLALADDASAAEANPAGLTILRKTEASIEIRNSEQRQIFATGGWHPNVLSSEFGSKSTDVAFASVVAPLGGLSGSLYYNSAVSVSSQVDALEKYPMPAYFLGPEGPLTQAQCAGRDDCVEHRLYPFHTSADVEMDTVGVSLAWKKEDWSFGGSFRYHEFSERAVSVRRDLDAPGAPEFVVTQQNGSRIYGDDSDSDFSWILGVRWEPASSWNFGVVYKKGPSFRAPVYAAVGGTGSGPGEMIGTPEFDMPDTLGLGVSWQPTSALTVNADLIWVDYSALMDDPVSVNEVKLGPDGQLEIESVTGYETDDAIEPHIGFEYFFQTSVPFAIRGGYWLDPAHSITYRGPNLDSHSVSAGILFPERDDENHFAVGLGWAFPRFQIDAAWDMADPGDKFSLSLLARF